MNSPKQLIIIGFFCLFFISTGIIYTSGTSYKVGEVYFSDEAKKGKIAFQRHNCIACHQVYGLGGFMGPDLTNSMSTGNNKEAIARAYLKVGTLKMPNFELSEEEIEQLISYLKYLDEASIYPVVDFEISPLGTIIFEEKNEQ